MLWFAQRVRELQEATFRRDESPSNSAAATRASRRCRNAGIACALGWILILDQAGADMADVPGGASGFPITPTWSAGTANICLVLLGNSVEPSF